MSLFHSRAASLQSIITKLQLKIDLLVKRSDRFSKCRLIVFLAGAVLTIAGFLFSIVAGWIILVLALTVFGIIVHLHNKLIWQINRFTRYKKIKEEHLARMKIEWKNIPEPLANDPPKDLTIEKDLDLTGNQSVHHLIDTSVSKEGSLMLRRWLTQYIPKKEEIHTKQIIVRQLAGLDSFRDKFHLRARMVSSKALLCEKILKGIKENRDENLPSWLIPVSAFLILTYAVLFFLNSFGVTNSIWIPFLFIYFFIYSSFQKKVSQIAESSVQFENHLKKLTALTEFIEKYSLDSAPELKRFLSEFTNSHDSPSAHLKKLNRNVSFLLARENPIIRLIVNLLFPYDFFFSMKVRMCKTSISTHIDSWLIKLNELECYMSLANFAFLNPDYAYPGFETVRKNILNVKMMGHPLIKRDTRVSNDFSLDKENEIVIMTGSNMSGKSTFLKTVGINFCLANSGAPVCAGEYNSSLFELFTCIKVTDSIIDGISYFYAEVKRLKELLDEFEVHEDVQKFFLIDEIFKGTNNKERLLGSQAYIKKLSQLKGTGFISTHDLELVNLDKTIPSVVNYHFREEIENGKMKFDYKIHKGPCPTTNALKIMEMSGLPVS